MTAKKYLLQAYLLEQRIESKLMQIRMLRELATKSTAVIRRDPGGKGNHHFMEDTIVQMADMEKEISGEIGRLMELKREITGVISQVEEPDQQVILEMRYLCYQDWPVIMDLVGRSKSSVFELHGKALETVGKIIAKERTDLE